MAQRADTDNRFISDACVPTAFNDGDMPI